MLRPRQVFPLPSKGREQGRLPPTHTQGFCRLKQGHWLNGKREPWTVLSSQKPWWEGLEAAHRGWGKTVLLRSGKGDGAMQVDWCGALKSCLLPSLAACVIHREKRVGGIKDDAELGFLHAMDEHTPTQGHGNGMSAGAGGYLGWSLS